VFIIQFGRVIPRVLLLCPYPIVCVQLCVCFSPTDRPNGHSFHRARCTIPIPHARPPPQPCTLVPSTLTASCPLFPFWLLTLFVDNSFIIHFSSNSFLSLSYSHSTSSDHPSTFGTLLTAPALRAGTLPDSSPWSSLRTSHCASSATRPAGRFFVVLSSSVLMITRVSLWYVVSNHLLHLLDAHSRSSAETSASSS
jgi:hypothetical protein